jgi:hypothetical protein
MITTLSFIFQSSVLLIILRHGPHTENTSIAPQWISCYSHARLGGSVLRALHINEQSTVYREHCFYYVFVGTCLLSCCPAMGPPGSIAYALSKSVTLQRALHSNEHSTELQRTLLLLVCVRWTCLLSRCLAMEPPGPIA